MALDFTKLFTILDKYVEHADAVDTLISDLTTDEQEIEDAFRDAGIDNITDDLPDLFDTFQNDLTSWITSSLKARTDDVLLNQGLVIDQISLVNTPTTRSVLEEIFKEMVAEDEFIDETYIDDGINGDWVYTTTHSDPFRVFAIRRIDGVTSPASGIAPFVPWSGEFSALFLQRGLEVRCTQDSESGGATRGSEEFEIRFGIPNGPYREEPEGAGSFTINACNNDNPFPQGQFESASSNGIPEGWTLESGEAGVDLEIGVGDGLRGSNCLILNPTDENILLQSILESSTTERHKSFLLAAVVKCTTVGSGTGTIGLYHGADVVLGELDLTDASAGWSILTKEIIIPAELDSAPYIKVVSDNAFTTDFYIDDICLVPVRYFEGVGLVVVALDDKILVGDSASVVVNDGDTGDLQEYLRKQYRFQLRQDVS